MSSSSTITKAEEKEIDSLIVNLENGKEDKEKAPSEVFIKLSDLKPNTIIRSYIRVSTLQQQLTGISLENQEKTINEKSALHGCDTVILYKDIAKSGTKTQKRTGLTTMLRDLMNHPGDVVMVTALDRLTRADGGADAILKVIYKCKCFLIALDFDVSPDESMRSIQYNMKKMMAKNEVVRTAERIKDVLGREKKNGTLRHRVPFGFKYNGKGLSITEDPDEQKTLEIIHNLCADPKVKNSMIARELTNLNRKMKNKKTKWPDASVRNIRIQQGWYPSEKIKSKSAKAIRPKYLKFFETEKKRDQVGKNNLTVKEDNEADESEQKD